MAAHAHQSEFVVSLDIDKEQVWLEVAVQTRFWHFLLNIGSCWCCKAIFTTTNRSDGMN